MAETEKLDMGTGSVKRKLFQLVIRDVNCQLKSLPVNLSLAGRLFDSAYTPEATSSLRIGRTS